MALSKRGKYWHYDFIYKGKRYQGSTDQTNVNKARLAEAAVRSNAALERLGVIQPKDAPLFKEFMEGRFIEDVKRHAKARSTAVFYAEKTRRLVAYEPWTTARLSDIEEEAIEKYKTWRLKSVSVFAVNREMATLRKALGLAYEWKLIPRRPRIRHLPGEKGRDFIVSGELETAYIEKAHYPLKQAAILMLDQGFRPEECLRLRRGDIANGVATVKAGKSKSAARSLPLTKRAAIAIELLCAVRPDSDYLFPGRKKGSHLRRNSLERLHSVLRKENEWPKEFVLYSFRHTFGTRLAESSNGDAFAIKTAMGHTDISVSQKYIHTTNAHLGLAMKRKEALDQIMRGDVNAPAETETPVSK